MRRNKSLLYWVAAALFVASVIWWVTFPRPIRKILFCIEYPVGLADDKLEPVFYPHIQPGHSTILMLLHFIYWLCLGLSAGLTYKWVTAAEAHDRSNHPAHR